MNSRIARWSFQACLALLVIFTGSGCVESPTERHLDLSGDGWKIHFEDSARFRAPDYEDFRWSSIQVPSNWSQLKVYPGVAWYRKRVTLDKNFIQFSDRPVALYIETILDSDETYWNGVRIGGMGKVDDYRSHAYGRPRSYVIPTELIRPGENVLAIRVRGYFGHDAGIRSGKIYLDDPVAIEARIVLAEQLQLLIGFIFVALAIGFFASCVYARSWHIRGWFAVGSWAAGWIQFWTTPLAYDWIEQIDEEMFSNLLIAPASPFAFVKMMDYGGYYLLGITGIAFWTAYLRLRNTPLHVIYYSFTLLMYSGCIISDDLLLWNALFDYWFLVTGPAMIWIVGILVIRNHNGESRWRWLLISFCVLTATAIHDWFFHNGLLSFSVPLMLYGLLLHQLMIALQLTWDFRRDSERSDAEFQRLWALRMKNQFYLRQVLDRLREDSASISSLSRGLTDSIPVGAPDLEAGFGAELKDTCAELGRLSHESLGALSQIESGGSQETRQAREPSV